LRIIPILPLGRSPHRHLGFDGDPAIPVAISPGHVKLPVVGSGLISPRCDSSLGPSD